jgi:N-acetylglucosaminyldiphosphoundecaprenol N-acetyl-beta-D-mannosaminyltransferase
LRFKVGKIEVNATDPESCLVDISTAINSRTFNYICVTNVRTAYLANKNPDYLRIQNSSLLTVPDGMPLVWYAHRRGFKNVGRVSGLNLMKALLAISAAEEYSHYFYGSTPDTIAKLVKNVSCKYPGAIIRKAISPPFQPAENINVEELAAEINSLRPTFFWVGLGAPKQEILMDKLQPLLKSTVCIGVGLSFEYLAGKVKQAPAWAQKAGMEWLFRTAQQPRNIKRIILPFSWFVGLYGLSFFNHKGHEGFH